MKQFIVVFFSVLLFGSGCSQDSDSGNQALHASKRNYGAGRGQSRIFRSVQPSDAFKLIKERPDILLVDVRSPKELKEGYIEGSVLVPFMDILRGKRTLPKDRPILLVCAVGGRSYGIGRALAKKGLPEIYNLSGGIAAWKKAGLPLKY